MEPHILHHNKGVRVKPRSKKEIRGLSNAFRTQFAKVDLHDKLDLLKVLEIILPKVSNYKFEFEVHSQNVMGDAEAAMSPDAMRMYIREDVYDHLHQNNARARFTVAHEIGHFILHDGVALARYNDGKHKVYEDSEWQANFFAAELLAPYSACETINDIPSLVDRFGISYECAEYRIREVNKTKN